MNPVLSLGNYVDLEVLSTCWLKSEDKIIKTLATLNLLTYFSCFIFALGILVTVISRCIWTVGLLLNTCFLCSGIY